MSPVIPEADQRWRCGACGNLTRFDVTRTRRTTEFWHFDLAGDHEVEDTELREESVELVTCRWCGRSDAVEVVSRTDVADVADVADAADAAEAADATDGSVGTGPGQGPSA